MSTKVAIVTGAGSNIGQRTVLALLGEGYSVTLAGRRAEALEDTAQSSGRSALTNINCAHRCDRSRLHSSLVRQDEGDLWQARRTV